MLSIHVDMKVAVHTAARDAIDAAGASGYVNLVDAEAVVLATIPLTYPCGTVSGTTGQLTITPNGRDKAAANGGFADHADICDKNGKKLLVLSCAEGSSPVADSCVLDSRTIVEGAPVEAISITIG